MKKIRIGIVGIGGFGKTHLEAISFWQEKGRCELAAAAVLGHDKPLAANPSFPPNMRIYPSCRELFEKEKGCLDLICLPVSIDQHAPLSIQAMQHGYNVLCEKPAAGTVQETLDMSKASRETGKMLAIGYQNIFTPVIQNLKKIRLSGKYGKLRAARTIALWPRSSAYYMRNGWAGKENFNGKNIFDSPLQNAVAHFLQNMLYIAGSAPDQAAEPESITGENFRAKQIESADTQCLKAVTGDGVRIYMAATHSVKDQYGPVTEYFFEKAKILYNVNAPAEIFDLNGNPAGEVAAGSVKLFPNEFDLIFQALEKNEKPLCHIDNARQHTFCINRLFAQAPVKKIRDVFIETITPEKEFYGADLDVKDARLDIIKNIDQDIRRCYNEEKTFSEAGLEWAG